MTYDFMLNLPPHRHRLWLTTRTDPLDIGYTNASLESLASADTVVPWIACGQSHVFVVSLQIILR